VTHDDNAAPDHRLTAAEVTDGDWADALRAHEQQFWREFGRAPVGLVMASLTADRRCAYLAVNVTYCQLTGYSRQELSGSDFLSCFHPQDQPALEVLIDDVTSGASAQIEADARLVRADGEIVWVHLTGSVRRWPAGQRYLAIFVQDSTAAWQARAEIQRLQHELQQTRRLASLGQLVGGISHDFSNTLTVIANYASLVRDEVIVAETTESAAKWGPVRWDVEQIEEAADEAKRLIKHLLAFARREEGEPILLDLGQTISDATGLLVEVLGEHVLLATGQSEGLWPVQADPGLLKQAILNIAVNARDAMPGGGQVVIDAVNVDTEDLSPEWQDAADIAELLPGRYVAFRVSDAGTGMDAITAERAFEPFFSTKNGDRAAGLGLPAVRRFATQAGGKAWLHSELGQGTTVTVVLPAAGQAGWQTETQQGRVVESAGTVLVVDDEASIRDVAHRVLTSAGYQVVTAANGHEALALLGDPKTPADLMVSDVVMPGMTAAAFAAQVRALRPGLPVLFMSGYERQSIAGEGWPDPGTEIIAKPFSRAALLTRVTQMLAVDIGTPR
jgi:PAS domain S-box-containing protein